MNYDSFTKYLILGLFFDTDHLYPEFLLNYRNPTENFRDSDISVSPIIGKLRKV